MINRYHFKDLIIVDQEGKIVYADVGNPQYFETGLASLRGKYLHQLYPAIGDDYPALIAAQKGIACDFFEVHLRNVRGITLKKAGCTYPIFKSGRPIGALEFADFLYDKEHIGEIEGHAEHLIYRKNNTKYIIDDIITGDKTMERIKAQIEKYAIADSNVLIYGETGTGKELIAQSLHNGSRRYSKKFVSLNCSAIPAALIESILFGTTRGSFTGAEDKPGLFEQADGGTLFLDEINSLDPPLQMKLLKAVETKIIRRIGSNKEVRMNVRVISATNEDPHRLIEEGRMKSDLYYRLSVIYIRLPKLMDRGNDILLLADYFIQYFNKKMNCSIESLSQEIRNVFLQYPWPGNVRELRNVIEGGIAFAENNRISIESLPPYLVENCSVEKGIRQRTDGRGGSASLNERKAGAERVIVYAAYERWHGNMTLAAEQLGISKQLLRYKLNKYDG